MSYDPFGATADIFGLTGSGETALEIIGASDGKDQGGEGLAHDGNGTIVANTGFDTDKANPSTDFLVVDSVDLSDISLGQRNGSGSYYRITGVDVETVNGAELPILKVSGDRVPKDSGRTFVLPAYTVTATYASQLFGACTLANCHALKGTFSAKLEQAPISTNGVGEPVGNDCSGGYVEVTIEVQGYTTTAPTVTPVSGWRIIKPLALTEPKTGYHTGSVTLRKDLTPAA